MPSTYIFMSRHKKLPKNSCRIVYATRRELSAHGSGAGEASLEHLRGYSSSCSTTPQSAEDYLGARIERYRVRAVEIDARPSLEPLT